jgi:lactoylglutathione lyase
MARIVHIALKVEDLEKATKFYEDVFGIYQTKTGHARGHTSRHMTDGNIDLALAVYDSEQARGAARRPGPCIHHIGIEVEDAATMKKITDNGGVIFWTGRNCPQVPLRTAQRRSSGSAATEEETATSRGSPHRHQVQDLERRRVLRTCSVSAGRHGTYRHFPAHDDGEPISRS